MRMPLKVGFLPAFGGPARQACEMSARGPAGGWGEAREQIRNGNSDLKKDYKNNKYNA